MGPNNTAVKKIAIVGGFVRDELSHLIHNESKNKIPRIISPFRSFCPGRKGYGVVRNGFRKPLYANGRRGARR